MRRERRLPSSKRAVSILQLWCTLTFMHVDARLALNQSWDHGGQHGQESEEGEEENRQEEKEVGLADSTTLAETYQGACASPLRGRYCRYLIWLSQSKSKPDQDAHVR
jgi:hypothetical protein